MRVPGSVEFASEINEVLLFGGRDGLYRFTGGTEYDFRSGQISGIGPVDGHAFAKTADMLTESVGQLAFVGENGFYITDGSAVQMLSQPTLDEVFEDHKTLAGNVIYLKSNEIIFSITQSSVIVEEEDITSTSDTAAFDVGVLPSGYANLRENHENIIDISDAISGLGTPVTMTISTAEVTDTDNAISYNRIVNERHSRSGQCLS